MKLKLNWDYDAWNDYLAYLTKGDKKSFNKINLLIDDIIKNGPLKGLGKPERLKYELNVFFSREINKKDRIVYRIENDILKIIQCCSHYENV